jgi:type VI secretion system protein ImpB
LPDVNERNFLEVDIDNFDARMKSIKPRVAMQVENTLTGQGNLSVDLTFENMADFSPAAIARKVDPLKSLLEARTQLSNLLSYMDGKNGAEELISQILRNPALLQSLSRLPETPMAKLSAHEDIESKE